MTSLAAVSLYWSVRACERRVSTLSWCHQRSIELRPSFINVMRFGASILYAMTAIFKLCCFACDAIKLKNVKLLTKHAPGD